MPQQREQSASSSATPTGATLAEEVLELVALGLQHRPKGLRARDEAWVRVRFGLGHVPTGLSVLANEAGVSSERVRQVEYQVLKAGLGQRPLSTLVQARRVADQLAAMDGWPTAEAERRVAPFLGSMSLLGALRVLWLLGLTRLRVKRVILQGARKITLLVSSASEADRYLAVRSAAYRLVRLHGLATRRELGVALARLGQRSSRSRVDALLPALPEILWLPGGDHFTVIGPSWLVRKAAAILAVAGGTLALESVMAGLKREMRRPRRMPLGSRPRLPDARTLRELLSLHPWFVVQTSGIGLARPLPLHAVLSPPQRMFVTHLMAFGGVAPRRVLVASAASRGDLSLVGVVSLTRYAGYLERAGAGCWRLRGWNPSRQEERGQHEAPGGRREKSGAVTTGLGMLPGGFADYADGRALEE